MSVAPEALPVEEIAKEEMQCLPSLCRGLYHRVAQKVGCDPSYVSRVARGERTSRAVSEALRAEIQLAWTKARDLANGAKSGNGNGAEESNGNGEIGVTPKIARRRSKEASA
jgi:hypothetical protein